jgi:histidinol-phosphatase (PHP family)
VTGPVGQARDLPLDSHLHTDQSPDSEVPIDVYAAAAVERGVAEIAITDHVDFDPRDPAYGYATFEDRERKVRQAAERWADRGVTIRFGAELTFNTRWEADVRDHLARHRYDFTIGSVHDWPGSPYARARVAGWAQDRPLDEIVAPYFEQVAAAARSGLFDAIGHLDVVKRYIHPFVRPAALADRPELLEAALRALVESGTSLEMNTSGLRHPVRETYPTAETAARYRAMGGRRVTIGSDAHRAEAFAFGLEEGYRILARAEFEELTFRRAGSRMAISLPSRFAS